MKVKYLGYVTLLVFVLALGCHTASSGKSASSTTSSSGASLSVSMKTTSKASRTIAADFSSNAASYKVSLINTRYSDTDVSQPDVKTLTSSSSTATFTSLTPDTTWKVDVKAYDSSSTLVAEGTLTNQTLTTGSNSVSVTLKGLQTSSGTGSYSFTFTVPSSTEIDKVVATRYSTAGVQQNQLTVQTSNSTLATSSSDSSLLTGTFSESSISSGYYYLELAFYSGSKIKGIYGEAVNIWDNVNSNKWLNSAGTLSSVRAFAVSDFSSSTVSLANLILSTSNSTSSNLLTLYNAANTSSAGFSSGTTDYVAYGTGSTFYITPTLTSTADGQTIKYSTDGGTNWTAITSGSTSAALSITDGSSVKIEGIASDLTTKVYTVTIDTLTASLTPASVTIHNGATSQLVGSYTPSTDASPTITWTSSNSAVASVNDSGLVTSVAVGSATITYAVSLGGSTSSATSAVTVDNTGDLTIAFGFSSYSGFSISATSSTLVLGSTFTMNANITSGATYAWKVYNSSGTSVATGTSSSLSFTPTSAGVYTITCYMTYNDTMYSGNYKLTVTEN